MAQIRAAGEKRDPIPAGKHTLTLKEVKPHVSDDPWHPVEDPNTGEQVPGKKEQLIWIFESDKKGQDGKPYEYATFTGLFYGDSRANLTTLLDMLMPNSTEDVKRNLDTDLLLGSKYEAQIAMQKNQKGNLVPKALFFAPISEKKEIPL